MVAPGPTDEARRYQIEAEIERLTPYRIEELAYDWSVEDDYALVVIAARETLIEAESFADGYGFNPVAFVAKPGPGEFSGEPFFGETMAAPRYLAQGDHVQPDGEPIREIAAPAAKAPPPAGSAAKTVAKTAGQSASELKAEAPKPESKPEPKPEPKPAAAKTAKPAPQPAAKADPVVPSAAPDVANPRPTAPSAPAKAAPSATASAPARPKVEIPPRPLSDTAEAGLARPRTPPLSAAPAEEGGKRGVGSLVRRMGSRLRREQNAPETAKPALPAELATKRAVPPVRPAVAGDAPKSPPRPRSKPRPQRARPGKATRKRPIRPAMRLSPSRSPRAAVRRPSWPPATLHRVMPRPAPVVVWP